MKRILLFCLFGIFAVVINAQQLEPEITKFDFESSLTPSYSTSYVTVSDVSLNNPHGIIIYNGTCGSSSYKTSLYNPNVNDLTFFEFSVQVDSGFQMDLTKLSFDAVRTATGPLNGAIRSSLDNYISDLAVFTFSQSSCSTHNAFLPASHAGVQQSITFRMYGYNASQQSANDRVLFIDNLVLNGEVTIIPGSPLPVQYLGLSAELYRENVLIKWITAQEINNDYFGIEKSMDGRRFTEIGRISGAGNSSFLSEYSFIDDAPLSTHAFYRIKQVDFNGEYEYSKILQVQGGKISDNVLVVKNADRNNLFFQLSSQQEELVNVQILDINGRVVEELSLPVSKGENSYELSVSKLAAGAYILKIAGLHGVLAEKFIK